MGVRGLNQKSKKLFCRGDSGELTAKKWLDSIEKQKRSNLKFVTNRQTDRQLLTIMTRRQARLGAEIKNNQIKTTSDRLPVKNVALGLHVNIERAALQFAIVSVCDI